jgi:hypothetical protein
VRPPNGRTAHRSAHTSLPTELIGKETRNLERAGITEDPTYTRYTNAELEVCDPNITWCAELRVHWDGHRWAKVASPPLLLGKYQELHGLAATSASDLWAVGETGKSGGRDTPASRTLHLLALARTGWRTCALGAWPPASGGALIPAAAN